MIRNILLGIRVRVCIYHGKARCKQVYSIAVMLISMQVHLWLLFLLHRVSILASLGTEKNELLLLQLPFHTITNVSAISQLCRNADMQ